MHSNVYITIHVLEDSTEPIESVFECMYVCVCVACMYKCLNNNIYITIHVLEDYTEPIESVFKCVYVCVCVCVPHVCA